MKKIVFILIFCGVGIFFFGGFLELKTYPQDDSSRVQGTSCSQAGERIGAQGVPERCCSGLVPMSGYDGGYTGECGEQEPMGGVFICSACGNNVCDVNNLENKCNCPKDCQ